MKTAQQLVAALVASQWLGADAAALAPRSSAPAPRVVGLGTQRSNTISALDRHRIVRRGDTVSATLDNLDTLYFVNGTLGTPAQSLRLHLDTGSSDLWVNTPSSALCAADDGASCAASGTYSANSSSTYAYLGSYFNISYVDGSGATGDYVTDTFSIGDVTLENFQFGIGYASTASQGILGIGYPANEVQVGRAHKEAYNNLPAALKATGLTQTAAYSLYLNSLASDTGTILFGGVDTDRFVAPLYTLPIQKQRGEYIEFLVTLTDVSLGSTVLASDLALAVLLDSGSSLTYLPDSMASEIFNMTNAVYDESEAVAFVPCSLAEQTATLNFTFSGPTISVDLAEMVIDLFDSSGKRLSFGNGVTACLFGVAPAGNGTVVLGDTFLRSAYVVYDLDNNEISLAQARFNVSASSVTEISAEDGVPSATAVDSPVVATAGIMADTNDDESAAGPRGKVPSVVASILCMLLVGATLSAI
jgi:hypothetical protein